MKVLVTGGAGYLGTGLISKLSNSKKVDEIIIYDNFSRSNRNLFIGKDKLNQCRITFLQADILDSRSLKRALVGVDVVYHLAANVTTPFSDQNPHLFEQINHWGTAELVYALEASEVKKLIYLSSVSVYGTSSEELTEESNLNPRTFYGISKMRGEEHVKRVMDKLDTYIIRCGNVYGYNKSMRFDAVINRFIFEANFKGRISINGSGSQHRPFVHIENASNILSNLSFSNLASGVYNLVDRNMAVGEIVEKLREIYPNLEMLFVNQHLSMRELKVASNKELMRLNDSKKIEFLDQLKDFKANFTF
jgi:UDP-glucose 4-epimerase